MMKWPLPWMIFWVGSGILTHADEPLRDPAVAIEKLCDGFAFTEGAASDGKGGIYFTDIPRQRIMHWSESQGCSVFLENSGRANGLWVADEQFLYACEGGSRRVSRIDRTTRKAEDWAVRFEGKRFASPNDLWPDEAGGWYFTDPRYGPKDDLEIDGFHVYYRHPDGRITRVLDNLELPNGIIGDPTRKLLYVADNGAGKVWAFPVIGAGQLGPARLLHEAACDGMTLDARGNLYLTTQAVVVLNPKGEVIDTIETPEVPANVCFGGPDGQQLFITARTSLYRLKMNVKGGRGSGLGF